MSRANEVRTLRKRAQEFLSQAKSASEKGYYDLSSLFSEQAAQLYLKSVLLQQIGDYPRIHSLRALLSEILKLAPSQELDTFIRENRIRISALEDTYIMARYTTKSYTVEDAEEFVKLSEDVINKVGELIKQ
jgi:HEPN domain-containing protein